MARAFASSMRFHPLLTRSSPSASSMGFSLLRQISTLPSPPPTPLLDKTQNHRPLPTTPSFFPSLKPHTLSTLSSKTPNPQTPNPKPLTSLILLDWLHDEVLCIPDIETSSKPIKLTCFPLPKPEPESESESESEDPFKGSFVKQMVGSINGLVCLKSEEKQLIVFNPLMTGGCYEDKFIKLPNPSIETEFYGFGWDKKGYEYKVVIIMNSLEKPSYRERKCLEVQIHTLGTNTWKRIGIIPNDICRRNTDGVFLNGNLHWFSRDEDFGNQIVRGIRSFNVEEETFGVVPVPFKVNQNFARLGVLGECLIIADSTFKDSVRVWRLKEYGVEKSWTLEFVIPMPVDCKSLELLGRLKNGNFILACDTPGTGDRKYFDHSDLLSYDPKTRTHEVLRVDRLPENFWAYPHVGTQFSLKDLDFIVMEDV